MYLSSFQDIVGFGSNVPTLQCKMMNVGVNIGKRVERKLAVRMRIVWEDYDQC